MLTRHFMGLGLLGALGCAPYNPVPPPDVTPIEVGLGAAMAIGQSSEIALSAISGNSACATVSQSCATYPCSGTVTVTLGNGCPLPLGGAASGTVTVSGQWQSATQATLQLTFANAVVGSKNVVVTSSTNLTVQQSNGHVTVGYTGQDVNVRGSVALAAQSVWTIDVDQAGTPADPSDDTYTISGTDQGGGGSTAQQVTASNVVLKPTCRQNPVAGNGTIQAVTSTSVEQVFLTFHPACDGTADTGGQSVSLNFFQ